MIPSGAKSLTPESRVRGAKAFAAISAVDGLRLNAASRRRLDQLKSAGLTVEQRRAEVLRAYTDLGQTR